MAKKNDKLDEEEFSDSFKYYKCTTVPGLSVQIAAPEKRSEVGILEVRFIPYRFWNEKVGENYTVGLLNTDEPEAIEILADDPNVEEIAEDEFLDLTDKGTRVPY